MVGRSIGATRMEPDCPSPGMVEKVGKALRWIGYVIQNGVSKSRVPRDLQFAVKRGRKLKKVFNDLIIRRRRSVSCRTCDLQDSQVPFVSPVAMGCMANDARMAYISPIEYQFSCSGSPPSRSPYFSHVRKGKPRTRPSRHRKPPRHRLSPSISTTRSYVGYFGNETSGSEVSSWNIDRIHPGVTDLEGDWWVDDAAEEFIDRFYRELRLQKWFTSSKASHSYPS